MTGARGKGGVGRLGEGYQYPRMVLNLPGGSCKYRLVNRSMQKEFQNKISINITCAAFLCRWLALQWPGGAMLTFYYHQGIFPDIFWSIFAVFLGSSEVHDGNSHLKVLFFL